MKKLNVNTLKDISEGIGAFIGAAFSPFLGDFVAGNSIHFDVRVYPLINFAFSFILGFALFQVIERLRPQAIQAVTGDANQDKATKQAGKRANFLSRGAIAAMLALFAGPIAQKLMSLIPGMIRS